MDKIDWEFHFEEDDENEIIKKNSSYEDFLDKFTKDLSDEINENILKELYKLGK